QRYNYVAWKPNPLKQCKLSEEEANVELARRYFEWIAPATLAEFQWFSGLTVKAAKTAIAALNLVRFDEETERLIAPEQRAKLEAFAPPKQPQYSLVSNLDSISLLRRDLAALLDINDLSREVFRDKDLPGHAILDRGRIIGLWLYDFEQHEICAWTFTK